MKFLKEKMLFFSGMIKHEIESLSVFFNTQYDINLDVVNSCSYYKAVQQADEKQSNPFPHEVVEGSFCILAIVFMVP